MGAEEEAERRRGAAVGARVVVRRQLKEGAARRSLRRCGGGFARPAAEGNPRASAAASRRRRLSFLRGWPQSGRRAPRHASLSAARGEYHAVSLLAPSPSGRRLPATIRAYRDADKARVQLLDSTQTLCSPCYPYTCTRDGGMCGGKVCRSLRVVRRAPSEK